MEGRGEVDLVFDDWGEETADSSGAFGTEHLWL